MIGYVTVGTNDLEKAARFYDAIAAEMGVGRMMEFDNFIAWGAPGGAAGVAASFMTSRWRMAAPAKARPARAVTASLPVISATRMATSSTPS